MVLTDTLELVVVDLFDRVGGIDLEEVGGLRWVEFHFFGSCDCGRWALCWYLLEISQLISGSIPIVSAEKAGGLLDFDVEDGEGGPEIVEIRFGDEDVFLENDEGEIDEAVGFA